MPRNFRGSLSAALVAALCACQSGRPAEAPGNELAHLRLPAGFAIETWARVPDARSLAVTQDGTSVYVGTGDGVFVVRDLEADGTADEVVLVSDQLDVPNGVATGPEDTLVIAAQDRVIRIDPEGEIETLVPPGVLPGRRYHGTRYAAFGPDGRVYVTIGAPCDVCEVRGFEGTVVRMEPSGHGLEVFARGVRHALGVDWHPATREMFFTDTGGDWLGDEIPPDELNHARQPYLHFGYPYVYGSGVPYTQFADYPPPVAVTPPVLAFEAHAAALGLEFYEGTMFPEAYRHDAFVAQHGSWNRSEPVGYQVMRVRFEGGRPVGNEVFARGWRSPDGRITGRPVDLAELPDGSLLVSDDHAGVIYRITYAPPPG